MTGSSTRIPSRLERQASGCKPARDNVLKSPVSRPEEREADREADRAASRTGTGAPVTAPMSAAWMFCAEARWYRER